MTALAYLEMDTVELPNGERRDPPGSAVNEAPPRYCFDQWDYVKFRQ